MWQTIKSFPGFDKMNVHHRWTPKLFLMAVLCLTLNADNETSNCENAIKVHRNTVYKASHREELKIECPVHFCNELPSTITWFKLETVTTRVNMSDRVKTEWTRTNKAEGISFLIFNNALSSDSGRYQCQYENDVSHTIIVTVIDATVNVNTTSQDRTNNTFTYDHVDREPMWLYLYTAAGILGFVIIVIVISVLSMRGCSGKRKHKAQNENQYMDIPMVEQPFHHSSNQALPRGSPREPPFHRTSRKKKSPPSVPTQRVNDYEQREDRLRNGLEEECSSVVYAALNHQHLAVATPRPRMVVEESSEYAAIRVP